MTSTYHALVPNADRTALLAVNGRLPVVQADTPRLAEVLELVARSLDLPSAFLRVAGRVKWGEDAVGLINEFDAPPPEWRPPPPAEWLPLEDADAAALAEPELAEPVRVWLDEQRGSPVPPQRSPWARPGWLSQASAWVGEHVEVHGDPRFVRQWPLSAIYRFETSQGPLHLKAAFVLFAREPAITAALATEHRGLVPDVFAIERERGWLLMREFGSRLAGDGDRSRWGEIYRTLAMIQRSWVGRAGELRKLGAPTRGLDTLFAATNSPAVQSGLRRLAALSLPDTLVHGDLHPYNAVVEPAGMRIIDWSDAAIAHPFVDLAAALYEVKEQDERRALHDAYLEPWVGVLPPGQLREAALLGEMAGCIYQAISYRAITESMEPSDRWLFAGYDREWLERAEDLGKALQPG